MPTIEYRIRSSEIKETASFYTLYQEREAIGQVIHIQGRAPIIWIYNSDVLKAIDKALLLHEAALTFGGYGDYMLVTEFVHPEKPSKVAT